MKYSITLEYHTQQSSIVLDQYTHSAGQQLQAYGIYPTQCSSTSLEFDTLNDRMLAILVLSGSKQYRITVP